MPFVQPLNQLVKLALVVLALGLSACSPNPYTAKPGIESRPTVVVPVPHDDAVPLEQDRVVVEGKVLRLPEKERSIAAYSLPQQAVVSPVVRNLVKKSQSLSGQGDFDNAANSLERALRIEPRNAMLWNRLADVRYLQKLWKKSIQLAAKSNTLSGSNQELRRENWYLMANSYKALGNSEAENKYRDKLIFNGY